MIESVASWFTPTVLFCFLNLMIGTILITSSLKTEKTKQPQLINRSPSLLHRVKSINLSFPDPFSSITHDFSDNSPEQLDRAPSLLQRIKSINLSFSRLERPDPIPSVAQYNEEQVQKVDAIEPQIANQEEGAGSHVTISKSSTCPAGVQTRTMVKSASEKKIPVSVAEVDGICSDRQGRGKRYRMGKMKQLIGKLMISLTSLGNNWSYRGLILFLGTRKCWIEEWGGE